MRTIDTLPRRRGVVIRDDGVIRDSYGTEYVRDEGNGMIHRVSTKASRNPPQQMFDIDVVMNAVRQDNETKNNISATA
jgi:hypothetical protein